MSKSESKRVGRFSLPHKFLIDAASHVRSECDAEFFAIFRRCVIVRAEMMAWNDKIEYTAYCDQFDDVYPGCECPLYHVEVTRSESSVGGVPVITFEPKFTREDRRAS